MLDHTNQPLRAAAPQTGQAPATADAATRTILFVITEDWFFHSHFMPMARAAIQAGYRVGVAARYDQHRDAIAAIGAHTFELSLKRGRFNPLGALSLIFRLYRLYRDLRPDLVHHISLKPVVLGGIAARLAKVPAMVNAVTGLGYLFTNPDPRLNTIRAMLRLVLKRTVGAPSSFNLLENRDDQRVLVENSITTDDRVTIVDGAGVDGAAFPAQPLPPRDAPNEPLKIALVARMLWSKGIDLAVDAVSQARAQGANVTLSLVGAPDPLNPQAVTEAQLRQWATQDGIEWLGRREDILRVWQDHDVALLPSRGGEGLPRSLIEAAACARPIITTDVPGCREIVIDGETGCLVNAEDVGALANTIITLTSKSQAELAAMATASRAHFETRFTEQAVTEKVVGLYQEAFTWAVQNGRLGAPDGDPDGHPTGQS